MVIDGIGRPKRPRANAEMIIEASEHHFRQRGFDKTTVADIAKGLGMSPANVYRFFHSKEELRRAVFGRTLDSGYSRALSISKLPTSAASRIKRFLKLQHAMSINVIAYHRTVHELILLSFNRDRDLVDGHIARVSDVLASVIADGIDRGEFAPQDLSRLPTIFIMAAIKIWHPLLLSTCRNDRPDELLDILCNALKQPIPLAPLK
ncbi:TetR/AcrR family transcriptional regulator [Rhizobium sullae]|uniref:TetR/AcrR family transcriptional regulator n=1 Tax=Rhizobium sullae TaxID=50338 RepID=UPI0015C6082E|nr:TetR/AcrR family transcriptional regulator [Rhizobium sullae]